ncbi:hypothetical protein RHMOL_Rhmol06G0058400 [Rhododendron molle]|uniref:Uncharacterized protein n=1 Tax=Rhododendron molle TaxID=49168 RepID=A0ACC0N9V5_RHOML|nr:hypothetical protein RHMOL_Rhmol06G0058400 [Rhododendron molle]
MNNVTIYGQVQLLRERNFRVVVRDERELNAISVREFETTQALSSLYHLNIPKLKLCIFQSNSMAVASSSSSSSSLDKTQPPTYENLITVLSIDGGGVRGIIPATILEYLESQLQVY